MLTTHSQGTSVVTSARTPRAQGPHRNNRSLSQASLPTKSSRRWEAGAQGKGSSGLQIFPRHGKEGAGDGERMHTTWVSNPNALLFIQTRVKLVNGKRPKPCAEGGGLPARPCLLHRVQAAKSVLPRGQPRATHLHSALQMLPGRPAGRQKQGINKKKQKHSVDFFFSSQSFWTNKSQPPSQEQGDLKTPPSHQCRPNPVFKLKNKPVYIVENFS